jgi:hypothetical protein
MPAYSIIVKIDQIVTKDVQLLIEADTPEAAEAKARGALEVYPAPIPYDPMIHRIVTKKSHYWIPKSIEVVAIKEDDENN